MSPTSFKFLMHLICSTNSDNPQARTSVSRVHTIIPTRGFWEFEMPVGAFDWTMGDLRLGEHARSRLDFDAVQDLPTPNSQAAHARQAIYSQVNALFEGTFILLKSTLPS